jgi:hypothetical protein
MANGKWRSAEGVGLSNHNFKGRKEVEVFGVTYDRYVLLQLHKLLARSLDLRDVVEMPRQGTKADGSLYSIGFAHCFMCRGEDE